MNCGAWKPLCDILQARGGGGAGSDERGQSRGAWRGTSSYIVECGEPRIDILGSRTV